MSILQDIQVNTIQDESTPIRSHQSYDTQVHAVCHHSGQYLTWSEANHPIWKRVITRFFREQHDFPGLRRLDRAFASAAHSMEHQHIIWSHVAIQSMALLLMAPLILFLVLTLFSLQDYIPQAFWYVYLAGLTLFGLGGLLMIVMALVRYGRRETLFHKRSDGKPPAIEDYPVKGKYEIHAEEHVIIDLDNVNRSQPTVLKQEGLLAVTLVPRQEQWEDYTTYRRLYEKHAVGNYMHGGRSFGRPLPRAVFRQCAGI